MRFEQHHQPLMPLRRFLARLARFGAAAAVIVLAALLVGVFGYHVFEGMGWLDALLNASLILSGMGPIQPLNTTGGKLFASFYALFSGLVLLSVTALLLAPIFHRVLHHFHVRETPAEKRK